MPTKTIQTAAPLIPANPTLARLRKAAAGCRACPLWKTGTQTVFGEGAAAAQLVLVGEQPGDAEDLQGRPFVGPAGSLLDRALAEAGIDRGAIYVTNAVKHFKWIPKGKKRLHQKPNAREVAACVPWLKAELSVTQPKVLVALGATATQAMFGSTVRVMRDRGNVFESEYAQKSFVTVHPSSILRSRTDEERAAAMKAFVKDLKAVARAML